MLLFRETFEKLNERIGYRGAGIALFREEPKEAFSVLVGKRAYNPGKGKWSFPGGGAERGEEPLKTAAREFWEETAVKLGWLKPTYIDHIRISMPLFEWDTFIFSTASHARFRIGHEFLKLGWAKESTFKRLNLHFGTIEAFKIYQKYRKEKLGLG
jgi:8-oxo-dGTP pyrophosphatase MutT (NUDIX family)